MASTFLLWAWRRLLRRPEQYVVKLGLRLRTLAQQPSLPYEGRCSRGRHGTIGCVTRRSVTYATPSWVGC